MVNNLFCPFTFAENKYKQITGYGMKKVTNVANAHLSHTIELKVKNICFGLLKMGVQNIVVAMLKGNSQMKLETGNNCFRKPVSEIQICVIRY